MRAIIVLLFSVSTVAFNSGTCAAETPQTDAKPGADAGAARTPKNAVEAFKGAWTGTWEITKGQHGQQPGKFAAKLDLDGDFKNSTGLLGGNVTIVAVKLKEFTAATKAVKMDLSYKIGGASFSFSFKGAFSSDWNTLEGEISNIMSSGTLKLTFGAGHEYKPG